MFSIKYWFVYLKENRYFVFMETLLIFNPVWNTSWLYLDFSKVKFVVKRKLNNLFIISFKNN
jgi:hypothetical protein